MLLSRAWFSVVFWVFFFKERNVVYFSLKSCYSSFHLGVVFFFFNSDEESEAEALNDFDTDKKA